MQPGAGQATPTDHARIDRLGAVLRAVERLALGLWLGTLGMAGATAAVIFPAMRTLDPRLPGFAAYDGPHHALAAGFVQARVFAVADIVQLACAGAAVFSVVVLALSGRLVVRGTGSVVRVGALAVATGLMLFGLTALGPRMHREVTAYWAAAAQGQNEPAERHRLAFSADHPTASRVLVGTFAAVGVAMALSGAGAGAGVGVGRGGGGS